MDFEAPVDAWYVWIAVSLVSVAVAGIAIGLPSGPPPDANRAANAVDGVTGSSYEANGSYEHDADEVRIDGKRISMRNEHGTSHASIAYGTVVPVMDDEDLETVAAGGAVAGQFDGEYEVVRRSASRTDPGEYTNTGSGGEFLKQLTIAGPDNDGEWRTADGEVHVRTVSLGGDEWDAVWYVYASEHTFDDINSEDDDWCEDALIGTGTCDAMSDEETWDSIRDEATKQGTADYRDWLEYDDDNDRFYVTVITA